MFWVCRGARGKLCCRTEPTVCLPNATGPLDEPPGQRVGSCGLVVTLAVNRANSVVTVLSIIRTPARRARATQAASLVVWRPVHPGQLHGLRLRQRCQVRVEFVHRFIIVDRLLPAVIPATGFAPVLLITPTKRVRHRVSIGSVSRGSRWCAPALRSGPRHRWPALPERLRRSTRRCGSARTVQRTTVPTRPNCESAEKVAGVACRIRRTMSH